MAFNLSFIQRLRAKQLIRTLPLYMIGLSLMTMAHEIKDFDVVHLKQQGCWCRAYIEVSRVESEDLNIKYLEHLDIWCSNVL